MLPPPRTVLVELGASTTITISVPAVLRTLQPRENVGLCLETTDLRPTETLRCEIASDDRPIEARSGESVYELRVRLAQWGREVASDVAVKLDTREKPRDPSRSTRSSS